MVPAQQHTTATGATVQANAYWTAARRQPPSPVVKRGDRHKACAKPPMVSNVRQAAQASAKQRGITGTHLIPIAPVGIATIGGEGMPVPILGSNNINFSANPVPEYSQLCNVPQNPDQKAGVIVDGPNMAHSKRIRFSLFGSKTRPKGISYG